MVKIEDYQILKIPVITFNADLTVKQEGSQEVKYFLFIREIMKWRMEAASFMIENEIAYLCKENWYIYWLSLNGMSESRIKEVMSKDSKYKHIGLWPLIFDTIKECKRFWGMELGIKFDDDIAVNIVDGIVYGNKPKVI